jgi:hypothetical protein
MPFERKGLSRPIMRKLGRAPQEVELRLREARDNAFSRPKASLETVLGNAQHDFWLVEAEATSDGHKQQWHSLKGRDPSRAHLRKN